MSLFQQALPLQDVRHQPLKGGCAMHAGNPSRGQQAPKNYYDGWSSFKKLKGDAHTPPFVHAWSSPLKIKLMPEVSRHNPLIKLMPEVSLYNPQASS